MNILMQGGRAAGAAAEAIQGAAQTASETAATKMSFWELFNSGGWLMWVLVLLGGIAIFLFVERFAAIWKASRMEANFMARIRDKIFEGNVAGAVETCRRTNSPIARMVGKGIERIGRPMPEIQNAIENQANLEVSRLSAGLPYLAMISGGAPMIGFLGTVIGLVQAFMAMEGMGGTVDISVLAGGMYVAMLTTVGGLIVGIPAYFGYNYLVARIDRLIFKMEANSIAFMDILNQPVK